MAQKFKIGDTVQVVKCVDTKNYPLDDGFKAGHRGKVIYCDCDALYHYVVKRKNGNEQCFTARELKLIKRKAK